MARPKKTEEIVEKPQVIDIDALKADLLQQLKFELAAERTAQEQTSSAQTSLTRSELRLSGEKEFVMSSSNDGFVLSEKDKPLISVNKAGAIGFGTKAPRTNGIGSAHFRVNYPSEAPMPTSGLNSTRGVIIESDADDEKTYSLRVVSRMNRQGFNLTGDGNINFGIMNDADNSKLCMVHTKNDTPALKVNISSKYFDNDVIALTAPHYNKEFNFLKASIKNTEGDNIDVLKIDGLGNVFFNNSSFSNNRGYAEMFEWADGNSRNENREGFTVALNSKGQLVIADEGDKPIGVVNSNAGFIGNAGWNVWKNTIIKDSQGKPALQKINIVEWLDDVGVLHSYYLDTLSKDFALPENAVIYETDVDGNDMYKQIKNPAVQDIEYVSRLDRRWGVVSIIGSVLMYKGQLTNPHWIKVRDINDEIEQWILK